MPKRIPIAAAKNIANEFDCSQVILLAFDHEGRTHCVTYGKTVADCAQAAEGGNRIKRFMGWPEDLCNAVPSRVGNQVRQPTRTGICFQCGKRLVDGVGHIVSGVERLVGGNPVRMHKVCAKTFDEDARPLTAGLALSHGHEIDE